MLKSYVALGVVTLLWVICGFSLAFGDSIGGVVGNPLTFAMFRGVGFEPEATLAPTIPLALFALFQLKFAIIAPALISGALTERIRFSSYLVFITLWSLCIYAPLAHMVWHPQGILRQLGLHDFAGGTVVHISAGFAALAGARLVGARNSHGHQPANIPLVLLGTGMLWFGWFGFNAGSSLAANGLAVKAFLTTNTASASALLAWLFLDLALGKKPSAMGACIGAVVGLVTITPGAGFVSVGASMFIGAAGSVISNLVVRVWPRSAIDDALDVFPCHGIGGMAGMVLVGIFAEGDGLLTGNVHGFATEIAIMVAVSAFTFCGAWLLYRVTNAWIPLRVSAEEERIGLDLSQHGETLASIVPDGLFAVANDAEPGTSITAALDAKTYRYSV
jgi:ammonium transporter, Amt family